MIVAIPVDEDNINSTVCFSFGRTPFFLIYNTDTKQEKFVDNSAISQMSGAGIKASQVLVDNNVNVLLTPRCGENAVAVLKEGNIRLYKTEGENIMENINLFLEGKLSVLDNIHKGFHGGH